MITPPTRRLPGRVSKRRRWLLLLIPVVIAGILFLTKSDQPAQLIVYPSGQLPFQKYAWPDRWIPISWGWYWRARDFIRGRPKPYTITVSIVEADETESPSLFPRNPALTTTNGLRVWLVDKAESERLQQAWKEAGMILAKPRASLSDGITASLSTSGPLETDPTITIERTVSLRPRSRGETTDLAVGVILTEQAASANPAAPSTNSKRTNTMFAARAQLPEKESLFFIKQAGQAGAKPIWTLVELTSP